jgi:BCD family chlorophyll transporter-like MFS transporter
MAANPARAMVWWQRLGERYLPFADAATAEFPLSRLLRLSLFQISVAMAGVLLTGTLNRVMIIELHVPAWLVAAMVAIPLLFAPFRALVGFKSDVHRSALGWRRVPYIWMGTVLQYGGLAIMPFALLVLSGISKQPAPPWLGPVAASLAFLLVGAGMHVTQTAGLALAADLAPEKSRPRVVSLLYVMLLAGTLVSALVCGALLQNFTPTRLVQVVQGAAALTMFLNIVALWKQEARDTKLTERPVDRDDSLRSRWATLNADGSRERFLTAVGLGTAAFTMQDILLEPYGAEILGLPVAATTQLTAFQALGTLVALTLAARRLGRGSDPYRLAAFGCLAGVAAFSAVIFASALHSPALFRLGTLLIGFGGGMFAVSTLTAAMDVDHSGITGLALGAWGAVQATAAGLGVACGGFGKDIVSGLAMHGALGSALSSPATGYTFVYHIEIFLLFAAMVAIGPLVKSAGVTNRRPVRQFGLAEFPG